MNEPIHDNKINRVLLKPRFSMERTEKVDVILKKFKEEFSSGVSEYEGKVVSHHVIIDVKKSEEHFWSPQLQLEVEEGEIGNTIIKGLFGPKPQIWTFFIFIHFGVALAFFVFATMLYSRWSLSEDYTLPLIICIVLPILWVILYFLGQLGKKKGYQQMKELDDYMFQVLDK